LYALLCFAVAGVSFFSALADGANFTGANMMLADLCIWDVYALLCRLLPQVCRSSERLLMAPTSPGQT
jgi:hypothetical protein